MAANDLLVQLVLRAVDQSLRSTLQGAVKDTQDLGRKAGAASADTTTLADALRKLSAAASAVGLGVLAKELISTADAYQLMEGRLKLVTGGQAGLEQAMRDVVAIAGETRTGLGATGTLYEKLMRNSQSLGIAQSDVADVTKILSQALGLSGASAETADAVIRQFSQTLGKGTINGDEFTSMMEGGAVIMEEAAKGMGVSFGSLKLLSSEGNLRVSEFLEGLQARKDAIDAQYQQLPVTVGRAMTTLQNAWTVYIGQVNQGVGATNAIAAVIEYLAANLDKLDVVLTAAASGGLVRLGQGLVAQVQAHQAAAAAATQQATAELAAATAAERDAAANLAAAEITQQRAVRAVATANAVMEHAVAEGYAATAIAAAQAESVAATNAATAAQARLAAVSVEAQAAQARLATATAAASSSTGVLSTAMGFLGGPAGVVMLAVTALGLLYTAFGGSKKGAEELNAEIDKQLQKLDQLTTNQLKALLQQQQQLIDSDRQAVAAAAEKVRALEKELATIVDNTEINEANLRTQRSSVAVSAELTAEKGALDAAVQRLTGNANKMGDTQARLNQVTGEGVTTAGAAAKSYTAIVDELARAAAAADSQSKAIAALTAASTAMVDVDTKATEILRSETAQAIQAAQAAQQRTTAAAAITAAKQQEVTVAGQQLAALQAELAVKQNLTATEQKNLADAAANLVAKKAATDQSAATTAALHLEAAAAQGVADYWQSGKTAMSEWQPVAAAAKAHLDGVAAAQRAGKATQDDVNRALEAAVRAETAYQTALKARAAATDAAIANAQRDRAIAEQTVQVKIDLMRAEQSLARARGDEQKAAQISIDMARLEVSQRQATVAGLRAELAAMEDKLAAQRQAAAADGQVTAAEQALIDALLDAVDARKLDIAQAEASVTASRAATEAANAEAAALRARNAARSGAAQATTSDTQATEGNTQATESNTQATNRAGAAAGGFGQIIRGVIDSIYELSAKAGDAFLGIDVSLGQMSKTAAEAARNLAMDKAADSWNRLISLTTTTQPGLTRWIQSAIELKIQVEEQIIGAEKLRARIEEASEAGTLKTYELAAATRAAANGFRLLDAEQLTGLRSAISDATEKMRDLRDEALSTLQDLQNEYDTLNNNLVAIERRSFASQRRELLDLLAAAKAANDRVAIAAINEALDKLSQVYDIKIKNAQADELAAQSADRAATAINGLATASLKAPVFEALSLGRAMEWAAQKTEEAHKKMTAFGAGEPI